MNESAAMDRILFWVQFSAFTLVAWWAGLHSAYRLLLVLQMIDVVTGVLAAGKRGAVRSRLGAMGIKRKSAAWFLIAALAYVQIELATVIDFPSTGGYGVAQWSAAGLAFMEFVSISENVAKMGVPLPKFLRTMLAETADKFGYDDPGEPEKRP